MPSVVLDASAVLAVLNGEPGADVVLAEIDNAVMSTVNYVEVASKLIDKGQNHRSAKEIIFRLGIQIADFTLPLAVRASALRSSTKHRGLSLGDRACLALAEREDCIALTSDTTWRDAVPTITVRLIR